MSGAADKAREILDRLDELAGSQPVSAYRKATICAALGEQERAFALLEEAFIARDLHLTGLRVDPLMDPLRGDPRFDDLLRRIGLDN